MLDTSTIFYVIDSFEAPDAGKDRRQKEKGAAEDEMVQGHHGLDGHEFERTPGARGGQRSLACCFVWGHKESKGLSDRTTTPLKYSH